MRRRSFTWLGCAAAVATPRWAAAQEGRRPRLAVVDSYEIVTQMAATGSNRLYGAFFRDLHRLGRIEGTNLTIERWSANGEHARVSTVARDVVASRPDAIFAGDTFSGRALRTWTSDIPIVAAGGSFHAWAALKSLSRPGGNVTGITLEETFDLVAKHTAEENQQIKGCRCGGDAPQDHETQSDKNDRLVAISLAQQADRHGYDKAWQYEETDKRADFVIFEVRNGPTDPAL